MTCLNNRDKAFSPKHDNEYVVIYTVISYFLSSNYSFYSTGYYFMPIGIPSNCSFYAMGYLRGLYYFMYIGILLNTYSVHHYISRFIHSFAFKASTLAASLCKFRD